MGLGVLAFVVAIVLSIALHEIGHLATAKAFGMKATQYFIGFGPRVWSFRRGETEYGIKAIPAGGFVKIEGMTPLEEVQPGDEDRAFWKFPARQRAVVLSAGSIMHFVLALVLVYGVIATAGLFDDNAPVIGSVSKCLNADGTSDCATGGSAPAPAAAAGLQAGDRIVAVNSQHISKWTQAVEKIRGAAGQPVTLTLRHDGHNRNVTLTPITVTRPTIDDPNKTETVGAIGVTAGISYKHYGPVAAAGQTGQALGHMVTGTFTVLTHKLSTLSRVYSKDRDPEGFVGAVGISRVSGEILSYPQESVGHRVGDFVLLVAGVNLFVGIFILVPLLPLDGGHLAIAGFEEARHRLRRLFGYRGAMRRVDLNKLMPVTYAFVLLLAGLTIYIAGADIVNPIKLTQ